jgi:hypothetical protein
MITRTRKTPSAARSPLNLAGLVVLCLIGLASILVEPYDSGPFTLCVFKNITGLACAGCGLTRACLYLGHGKIEEAAQMNPLVFPVVSLLIVQFVKLAALVFTSVDYQFVPGKVAGRFLIGLATAAVAATWLAKLSSL